MRQILPLLLKLDSWPLPRTGMRYERASIPSWSKASGNDSCLNVRVCVNDMSDYDTWANQTTKRQPLKQWRVLNTEQKERVCILMPYVTLLIMCVFQKSGGVKRSNPIYLFYGVVPQNASAQPGDPGDKHYQCCHGNHKILMVTKSMNSHHLWKDETWLCRWCVTVCIPQIIQDKSVSILRDPLC